MTYIGNGLSSMLIPGLIDGDAKPISPLFFLLGDMVGEDTRVLLHGPWRQLGLVQISS